MREQRLSWLAITLFTLTSGQVLAQSCTDERIEKLEETIAGLERRIAALEGSQADGKVETTVSPGVAAWRKLQKGMSRQAVEQILGSPTRVNEYGSFTVLMYETSSGRGRIHIDGKSQSVQSWSEP